MTQTIKSVLVVDDDAGIRDAIKQALEIEGYQVELAADGREALDRLKRLPSPSLILLDLMMPDIDGWQVLNEMDKEPDSPGSLVPKIMCSAAGDLTTKISKRVDGYLKKPIELDDLLDVVGKYCGPEAI